MDFSAVVNYLSRSQEYNSLEHLANLYIKIEHVKFKHTRFSIPSQEWKYRYRKGCFKFVGILVFLLFSLLYLLLNIVRKNTRKFSLQPRKLQL